MPSEQAPVLTMETMSIMPSPSGLKVPPLMTNLAANNPNLTNHCMPRALQNRSPLSTSLQALNAPSPWYKTALLTLNTPCGLSSALVHYPCSPSQSGRTSSVDQRSTLTPSSWDYSPLLWTTRPLHCLVVSSSHLVAAGHPKLFRPMGTGPSLGMQLLPQSDMSTLTMPKSSSTTPSMLFSFLVPSLPAPTTKSSSSTKQFRNMLEKSTTSSSAALAVFGILKLTTSRTTDLAHLVSPSQKRKWSLIGPLKPVVSRTVEPVTDMLLSVTIDTSIPLVVGNTQSQNVQRRIETEPCYLHPWFAWDFLWGPLTDSVSLASQYSLFADPLPHPPQSELQNVITNWTISDNPDLFKITCNININVLADLLVDHPN